jgi:hypothetical protein
MVSYVLVSYVLVGYVLQRNSSTAPTLRNWCASGTRLGCSQTSPALSSQPSPTLWTTPTTRVCSTEDVKPATVAFTPRCETRSYRFRATLVVWRLDRLGRSMRSIVNTLDDLTTARDHRAIGPRGGRYEHELYRYLNLDD